MNSGILSRRLAKAGALTVRITDQFGLLFAYRVVGWEANNMIRYRKLLVVAAVFLVGGCGSSSKPTSEQFWDAVAKGETAKAAKALESNSSFINLRTSIGVTPLHLAAWNGHKDMTELLISKGIDVSVKAEDGETPLYGAAENGRIALVELLLARGADVNARKDGETPLSAAKRRRHTDVEALLRQHGGTEGSRR